MKNIIITFTLYILSHSAFSQQESYSRLLSDDIKISGWFLDIPATYSEINNERIFMPGLSLGVTINQKIRIGLSGADYSHKFNRIYLKEADDSKGGYIEGNEGGLLIEPVLGNRKLFHLTFPIVVGGGHTEILSKELYPDEDNEMDEKELGEQSYFLFKPSAQVEINLHQFIRLAAGVGYRFTSKNKFDNLDIEDLSGLSSQVSIKIGKF